jgi:hypothetical protein
MLNLSTLSRRKFFFWQYIIYLIEFFTEKSKSKSVRKSAEFYGSDDEEGGLYLSPENGE